MWSGCGLLPRVDLGPGPLREGHCVRCRAQVGWEGRGEGRVVVSREEIGEGRERVVVSGEKIGEGRGREVGGKQGGDRGGEGRGGWW